NWGSGGGCSRVPRYAQTRPPFSTTGTALARTLSLKLLSTGSLGMSTQRPVTSNFPPWYTHRSTPSSFRPKNRDAPRCGHCAGNIPTTPALSRKAMKRSPSRSTRTGSESGPGSSLESNAGTQYSRIIDPSGVPGPTFVSTSLSLGLSILHSWASNFHWTPARVEWRRRPEHELVFNNFATERPTGQGVPRVAQGEAVDQSGELLERPFEEPGNHEACG